MSRNLPLTVCMAISYHRYVKHLCKRFLWLQLFAQCVFRLKTQHCLLIMRAQRLHMEGGDYCGIISSHINPTDHRSNSTSLSAALQCLQSTSQGGFILCLLTLFILAPVNMWCLGFLSPGLGGYCGGEIGGCGRPPWAAHIKKRGVKIRLTLFLSLPCHSLHLGLGVTPCGRAVVSCSCWLCEEPQWGFRDSNTHAPSL